MTRLVNPLALVAIIGLALSGCPDPLDGSADAADATPAAELPDDPTGEDHEAVAVAAAEDGGKTANPGREQLDVSSVTWDEQPLELGFKTKKGWQVFHGQGMCKPAAACQELKAVREGEEKALETRNDVSGLVSLIANKDDALALVRFFTDHKSALSDEHCSEIGLTEEGELHFKLPESLELEAPLPAHPVKVVDFEGGYRVERTLICVGEEKDRVVWSAETVFTPGNWEREEVEVLLEHEGLVKRLK